MVVDLRDRDLDTLFGRLSSQRRSAVRSAAKRGVEVRRSRPGDGALLLPRLLDEAFEARGRRSPYPPSIGRWVDRALESGADYLAACTAVRDGVPVGMLTTVIGPRADFGWIGGALRAHRDANVAAAMYWQEIRSAAARGAEELDLVGEVDAGVKTFKHSFGARSAPYRRGTLTPLPGWLLEAGAALRRRTPRPGVERARV